MPTLFYGVFLEITETSVLVSCLLCFGCSCWSVFGGAGIWKNLGNLGLYTDLVKDKIFVFAILFTHKKKCQTLFHINPRNQVLHSFTDYFEYTKKVYIKS